ncbi:MAG: hypothetical protein M1840_000268 [Geoglossum simile]|nr:MAG: hypothetical protein M1840_000268 [Geoglossum simile]
MASYNSHFSPPNRPDVALMLKSSALSNRVRSKTSATLPPSKSSIPTSSSSALPRSKTARVTNGAYSTDRSREPHAPNAPSEARPSTTAASDLGSNLRPKTPSNLSFGFSIGPGISPEKVKPPRNVLRRKPSSINQHTVFVHVSRMGSELSVDESNTSLVTSGSTSMGDGFTDPFPGSILGITMPTTTSSIPSLSTASRKKLEYGPGSIENLPSAMPQKPVIYDFPPPTPCYNAHTSSPSTRYSESPGPWSRTSTPTSMSSHSPGISYPTNLMTRVPHQNHSWSRPPVTRRRAGSCDEEGGSIIDAQGLSSLRESLNSSSSGSTVKCGDRGDERKDTNAKEKKKKKKKRLSPPPPSPPPRKSSQTFARKKSLHNISEGYGAAVPAMSVAAATPHPSSSQRAPNISSPPLGEAPVRPSREGTSNLGAHNRQAIPVIQSNLTNLQTTSHRRQGSFGASGSLPTTRKGSFSTENPASTHSLLRSGGTSRIPSRNPSPSPSQLSSRRGIPSLSSGAAEESKDGKTHSPGKSLSTSRFGLFSRRPKPNPELSLTEKREKPAKKGPTAGTGYEGYGKYSLRGRSGSTTSTSGSWARSTSASSAAGSNNRSASSRKGSNASKSEFENDGFLVDRLDPVFISGGGAAESRRSGVNTVGSGSSQGSGGRRPSTESKNSSIQTPMKSKTSNELPWPNFAHPSVPSDPLPKPPFSKSPARSSQDYSNENATTMPSLAARRSQNRSQLLSGMEPMNIPTPIDTLITAPSPSTQSTDATSRYSTPALVTSDTSEEKEAPKIMPRKADKRAKSPRRWNFFQRTQNNAQKSPVVTEVPVTVARRPPPRQVAHYALLDSGYQDGSDDLEVIMNEIEESGQSGGNPDYANLSPYTSELRRQEHVHSILLPDPPSLPPGLRSTRPSSPKVLLRPPPILPLQEPERPAEAPAKRSRLAQVGRIPRVVSTRDRQSPLQTFSRPPPAQQGAVDYRAPSAAPQLDFDPAEGARLIAWPDYTKGTGDFAAHDPIPSEKTPVAAEPRTPRRKQQKQVARGDEFLAFPPRKMSEMSSSSSGMMSSAATTAVIPDPESALGEDEVWNEYDDLIDNVLSPELHLSDKPSLRSPFKDTRLPDQGAQPRESVKESPTIGSATKAATRLFRPKVFGRLSSPFGSPTRTSKTSVMNSACMPATPLSFTDFFAGYGERNLSVIEPLSPRNKVFNKNWPNSGTSHSKSDTTPDFSARSEVDDPDSPITGFSKTESDGLGPQTNLRLAAMTTCKWLSFGRVLFSPAHIEVVQATTRPAGNRVLVLDGLGNDDWPYFCALTYPHATIYNLSPSPPSATASAKGGSGTIQTAENYRQIYHPDLDNPFPFPRGFFNAVVFRFPTINSEAAYRFAISESKRVLRPGGYLEISVLDLDMMNMGNRARRAVRMLKVKLHVEDDTLSLRPISDNIQRMLGRRGFENLNRCMVGVPVAGRVADSRAGSLDEREFSYNNTEKDRTQGDEGVTKMAPRVGRWWYSRCYESPLFPENGDVSRSIWNDRALLRECEKRKTSFKMLLCYAQKPLAPLRRTVSV